MLEKSFGLLFFLKQPKKHSKDALHYVYLRITVDGVQREYSLKKKWDPLRWDGGRATGTKEDAKSLNAHLNVITAKTNEARIYLLERGEAVTADTIKDILLGRNNEQRMLLETFKVHNQKLASLVKIDFAEATLTRYQTSYTHTYNFIRTKYGKEDIPLSKLNYEFVSDYFHWLKTVRKCNQNSALKYMSNFKKIVLDCLLKGWITRDPFWEFKAKKKKVNRVALTAEELDRIKNKEFEIEGLSLVRDAFLFSCYTGLAYIDVKKLKKSDIIIRENNERWISTFRQKTKSITRLPILPMADEILSRYENHPKCLGQGVVMPMYTNQKVNQYLKEIADVCGVSKQLTFHIARHTFATTITLANGVPIETVSKMLGHSNIQQTQHYAKILDFKVGEDMKILKDKLHPTIV